MDEKITKALNSGIITEENAHLLNIYSERLRKNGVPVIYNLRHLRKLLLIRKNAQDNFFGKNRSQNYATFYIPKKSKKWRKIQAPKEQLKQVQRWIKNQILEKVYVSKFATGFVKCSNIVENAKRHIGKELVINLDIKDFFPSIKYDRILKIFVYLGYTIEVANLLTKICTTSNNCLPQGSPASPIISNIVCLKLDKRLSKLAEKVKCNYSRYADDITISGSVDCKLILNLVKKIIASEKFCVNESKVRLQYRNQKQVVTGLVVNTKINVDNTIIKEIENAIYFCTKYGVANHMNRIQCDRAFYKEHLYGMVYFINMIDEQRAMKYLKQLNAINWDY